MPKNTGSGTLLLSTINTQTQIVQIYSKKEKNFRPNAQNIVQNVHSKNPLHGDRKSQ